MAVTFRCTIPGPPQEQTRGRIVRINGHGAIANTAKVANYRAFAKIYIAEAQGEIPPIDGPLWMRVWIFVAKPKSWPRRRVHADTKPDVDNFCKLIMDCCEGIVYTNDSRVVEMDVRKYLGERPRVEIECGEIQ